MGDLAALLAALDLEPLAAAREGTASFRGGDAGLDLPRAFGGQLLAQAVVAAGRTVGPDRFASSALASFVRAGDALRPLVLDVERIREGRSMSVRQVRVNQDGRLLCIVTATFAAAAHGPEHQATIPSPADPTDVPELSESARAWGGLSAAWLELGAMQIRVDPVLVAPESVPQPAATDTVWVRPRGSLPSDPLVHSAVLAFMTDTTLLSAGSVPHGVRIGERDLGRPDFIAASLDHSLWFHRPVLLAGWVRVQQRSPVATGGRALMQAELFDESGRLIASVAQQGRLGPSGPIPTSRG